MTTFADGENGLSVRTKINDVLQHMDGTAGTLVVNEAGADVDFRVESDTLASALFVDGATGNVSLGTSAPGSKLDIYGAAPSAGLNTQIINSTDTGGDNTRYAGLNFVIGSDSSTASIRAFRTNSATDYSNALTFWTKGAGAGATTPTERMRITETGNVGVGTATVPGGVRMAVAGGGIALTTNATYFNSTTAGGAGVRMLGINSGDVAYVGPIDSGPGAMILNAAPSSVFTYFYTGGTEKMRLDATGNLGIGTSTLGARLSTSQVISAVRTSSVILNGAYAAGDLSHGVGFSINGNAVSAGVYAADGGGGGINLTFTTSTSFTAPTNTERMRINTAGDVGIGTVAPGARLDIVSATGTASGIRLSQLGWNYQTRFGAVGSSGDQQYWVGNYNVFANTVDSATSFTSYILQNLGAGTISFGTSSVVNAAPTERMRIDSAGRMLIGTTTASGANLLQVASDSLFNTVRVGLGAGAVGSNTIIGAGSLVTNTTGNSNTATGFGTLYSNTTGSFNTANGYGALFSSTTGNANTAVGSSALYGNTTGANNIAVGNVALTLNTTGSGNTAVGYAALYTNTTASNNTGIGFQALQFSTTGVNNTALGSTAMNASTTGNNNTSIGTSSLLANTTGGNNTVIGQGAGSALTTGDNNTIIGRVAGTAGLANTVIIGAGATERLRIDASGNMSIGDAPVAWSASYKAFNIASSFSSIASNGANRIQMGANNYFDGTNYIYGASSFATRYEQVLGVHSWHNAPSGTAAGTITFTQAMTLDNSGNLGVGITAPGHKLHVASAGNNYIASHNTAGSTSALLLGAESGSTNIYSWTTAAGATGVPLRFTVGASESMRIDTAGNLGVGTISPNAASIIDAQSTTKGVRFPNMTTTQKNAIANVAGNVIFDTTLGKLCVNTGSGWQTITSA